MATGSDTETRSDVPAGLHWSGEILVTSCCVHQDRDVPVYDYYMCFYIGKCVSVMFEGSTLIN